MTRGERNCNPGNVRRGHDMWAGEAVPQTDPDFVQFSSPEYGIRAIVKIIRSYERAGINTVQGVIDRWAPPSENETQAYVSDVCYRCSVHPDEPVDLDTIMPALVKAIIRHENGECPYSDDLIAKGISLA